MKKVEKGTGVLVGGVLALTFMGMAFVSVLSGDVRFHLAGLDVTVRNQAETGLVIQIDSADCPGKGCPAFALNWIGSERG